jgi:hypothetical protein
MEIALQPAVLQGEALHGVTVTIMATVPTAADIERDAVAVW